MADAIISGVVQSVAEPVEKRQVEDEVMRDWLRKLGDVVYEADDLLDGFSTQVLRRGRWILNEIQIFFSSSNQFSYSLKMAHQVKDLRSRIDVICKDKVQFQLDGNAASYPESSGLSSFGRETIPCMYEPHVIGRDNDKKRIMKFLYHASEENVTILAISLLLTCDAFYDEL